MGKFLCLYSRYLMGADWLTTLLPHLSWTKASSEFDTCSLLVVRLQRLQVCLHRGEDCRTSVILDRGTPRAMGSVGTGGPQFLRFRRNTAKARRRSRAPVVGTRPLHHGED